MSKYNGLIDLLAARGGSRVSLQFAEISEAVIGGLPRSAYKWNAWWENDPNGHSQAQTWLDAGWRVDEVDRDGEVVTFARD